jgi:hypothetical protein
MNPQSASNLMRGIAIVSFVTSATFALAVRFDPTGLNDLFFRYASSGQAGLAGVATQEAKLALAIAGGAFVGISAMLLLIAVPALRAGDKARIRGVTLSLLAWFVVDSTASALGGNAVNIIPNVAVLLLFLAPILLIKIPE